MAFMTIDVDVEASNSRIDAAVMTLTITTPSPTARPTHTHTPTSGACDSIHVHYGEACSSAHGDAHGCPIVNVPRETWYYDLWSCDDMCGRVGGWCERAAYMSNNHCGSDVHEEYELSCDQGIRDSGLTYPSHTLCWCRGHYYPYYDDEDDDDDDGGSSRHVRRTRRDWPHVYGHQHRCNRECGPGTMRIRTDDRLRGWDDAPLLSASGVLLVIQLASVAAMA